LQAGEDRPAARRGSSAESESFSMGVICRSGWLESVAHGVECYGLDPKTPETLNKNFNIRASNPIPAQ